jgi:predicted alpha-1,2-mannosidase
MINLSKIHTSNCFLVLFLVFFAISCHKEEQTTKSLSDYVNPFIGTGAHGHTYPGATTPFGMIQLSPDNGVGGWDWCSGYHYSSDTIAGFSHLHLSGTGIGDLCDLLVMPVSSPIDIESLKGHKAYSSGFSHETETATPGYYKVLLEKDSIKAELTTSKRVGYHRYTYKKGQNQSVILDLGFAINWDSPVATFIQAEDDHTVSGYRHSAGWAKNQKVFFTAKFSKPIANKQILNQGNARAVFNFDAHSGDVLLMKLALSSVSVENAKLNMESDPDDFDFDRIKLEAETNWNTSLSNIQVETANETLKEIFYTAVYHSQVAPVTFSDVNGEYRKSNDSIVKADYDVYSTFSLWDTFRAEHPLLTLTASDKVGDMIQSMLDNYDGRGTLPVWTLYGNETYTMTGYHSIPVIVDAYFKGIRNFNVEKAYAAMVETMMADERGLNFYKEYGYIPFNKLDESVTITLEYAFDDWCVAKLAKAMGKEKDYEYFSKRSQAYLHLFDEETGFMRGKNEDGTAWNTPFDPKYSAHRVHADYTEGNAWQHSWFVPHDIKGLINVHGGNDKFVDKLEQLFLESSEITGDNVSADISGLIGQYAHGNEPSHHIAYLFNEAGAAWKTQYWVNQILKSQYSATPEGLSGNEDCGQMSAWYIWSSIGLYPVNPASGVYQLGSPLLDKSVIHVSENTSFSIIANQVSDKNIYIQSATLNGKILNRTYITHREIISGGSLELQMGDQPDKSWPKN